MTETVTQLEPSGQPWIDIHYWITSLSSSLVAWFGNCSRTHSRTLTTTADVTHCVSLVGIRYLIAAIQELSLLVRVVAEEVLLQLVLLPRQILPFFSFKRLLSATTGTGCSVLAVDGYELLSWNMWRPWKPLAQSFTDHFLLLFSSLQSDYFVIIIFIWVQYIEHKPYNIIISKLRSPSTTVKTNFNTALTVGHK